MRLPMWNSPLAVTALLLASLAGCAGAAGSSSAAGPNSAAQSEPGAQSLSARVIALIVRETGAPEERVTLKARFVEDLGLDELDMIELVTAMEEGFGIVVSEEDFKSLVTVADAIEYVRTHMRP